MKIGNQNKQKTLLKINEDKGILTIQAKQMAIQAIFTSPVIDVCAYLEQFEKYYYRAALSSLNLKVAEFDQYYSEIREKSDNLYYSLIERSVSIFQDLVIAAKLAKIQVWHQQAMITNGLKNYLFLKSVDPYDFNPTQFQSNRQEVLDKLKEPANKLEENRQIIQQLTNKLKEIEAQKMEQMFAGRVHHPYTAQNKEGLNIDPSSIYSSYLSYLRYKTERSEEALKRKHCSIHEQIIKFGQSFFQHSLKLQKYAFLVIRKYCQCSQTIFQTTHIVPPLQLQSRRQHLDADQLFLGKQARSESKFALTNKNYKLQFKQYDRVLSIATGTEELVEQIQNEERGQFDNQQINEYSPARQSPFESFTERRRVVYKDFYQHRQLQKKMREQQLRFSFKQRRDSRERQKVIVRRIIRANFLPAPWSEFIQSESPFFYYLQTRQLKEATIWETKSKEGENDFLNYRNKKQRGMFPANEESKKVSQTENIPIEVSNQSSLAYEKRRKEQQYVRIRSLKSLLKVKTYRRFLQISKMEIKESKLTEEQVQRYGLTIHTQLSRNDPANMDKFFYYYFKERYFRQNEWVKDNADNPIIFLDSNKINMNSIPKLVSQLVGSVVKRTQSLSFFLLWSQDIIGFRLTKDAQGKETGAFEFFSYGGDNCEKLIYQVKRRTAIEIAQKICQQFKNLNPIDQVMSKVEAAHRIIYQRHYPINTQQESVRKGAEIMKQILETLNNDYSN